MQRRDTRARRRLWDIQRAEVMIVCRNIRTLYNFDPPAGEEEIRAAALQYVRKISGFGKPSAANQAAFERAVDDVTRASRSLFEALVTTAAPRNREDVTAKAHARALRRFPRGGEAPYGASSGRTRSS